MHWGCTEVFEIRLGGNAESFGNWILGRKNVLEVLGFWSLRGMKI